MKKLLRILAAAVLGVSLLTGVAAAQSGTIDTTGAESKNEVKVANKLDADASNYNDVDGTVGASQKAVSGEADVKKNTEGGDAETGDAENDNTVEATVELNNTGADFDGLCDCFGGGDADATIENTGYSSENTVEIKNNLDWDVNNTNDVDFTNNVDQDAFTGDASTNMNTSGGNATTGSATNTSSTTVDISIVN